MMKVMRVAFKDGRPEEEYAIAGFRDSKMGCRIQADDGRDLGYFGPEHCRNIVVEIRFDDIAKEIGPSS
jgi:hypothetical protein